MSAETPTPVPLGEIAALLEQAAESWSIDAETAILVGHRAASVEEFHRLAPAAAPTREGTQREEWVIEGTMSRKLEPYPWEWHDSEATARERYQQIMDDRTPPVKLRLLHKRVITETVIEGATEP